MATIRVSIEINKGVRGVPLDKLATIVGNAQKFLSMLSDDIGLPSSAESWVGLDFANGSLSFVAEKAESATLEEARNFNAVFTSITEKTPDSVLRRATIAQYAKIAEPIGPEEAISFGLYEPQPDLDRDKIEFDGEDAEDAEFDGQQRLLGSSALVPLRRFDLTQHEAKAIGLEVQASVRAFGALQGRIHSLFLGSQPPYFNLRELSSGSLVRCTYGPDKYDEIAGALKRKNAVLHVFGYTTTDLVQRKLEEMEVDRVDLAPVITEEEFDRLFGISPTFTGPLTTQEFINHMRGRDN